jgi:hypothetical protein
VEDGAAQNAAKGRADRSDAVQQADRFGLSARRAGRSVTASVLPDTASSGQITCVAPKQTRIGTVPDPSPSIASPVMHTTATPRTKSPPLSIAHGPNRVPKPPTRRYRNRRRSTSIDNNGAGPDPLETWHR